MSVSNVGKRFLSMKQKIEQALAPTVLNIIDDSARHADHEPMRGLLVIETHFIVEVVSAKFSGKSLIERHRMVNELLKEEFDAGLHALNMKTKTPEEWAKMQQKQ